MLNSADIRKTFLDFFSSKGHTIVPSAPIVVKNDPTLMFTNAGMNQFKDYFLGNRKPANARVADTQKCLRVSGKHNDLEEVGVDTYHHTMFEMLGNWSFGDAANPGAGYFKKEAIAWSWELLTKVYQLPEDRLYVTVFEGDPKENLPMDTEAATEWIKHIQHDRVLPFGKKDNFWEMGDTGPCGPCTEIHVDTRPDELRKKIDGRTLVNQDDPAVIEIWNNVFIEFNRLKNGSLEPLPAKHVDTGMGLERLVRVMQHKSSNYDTDLFSHMISEIKEITRQPADIYKDAESKASIAVRVISDHIRAIAFTIADGQLPSNTGAGYVIRRILRRAVRYYFTYLHFKQPLLFQLIPLLAKQFDSVFPELKNQAEFVSKVVREEEEAFLRTLDKGLKRVDEITNNSSSAIIKGADAFELYDTYGFPLDLTKLIASEKNMQVDEAGFDNEMKAQKDRSRAATTISTEDWVMLKDGSGKFVGYTELETAAHILKYRKINSKGREGYQLVLDNCPFYAESGGQVGDTGILQSGGEEINVLDTKKENDLVILFTDRLPADPSAGLTGIVDREKRRNTELHHSATHLLHAALRKVLGTHVIQKGSLVNAEHLRFDFSHFAKLSDEELNAVEELVNEKIRENIPVVTRLMSKEEALKIGAMALFGEKYSDMVRVVTIDPAYSIELCGGTHVGATGQLGYFKITHESAVAAGVRRIIAICGKEAAVYINEHFELLKRLSATLKNPKDISRAVEQVLEQNSELEKKLEHIEARQLVGLRNELLHKDEIVNGITFVGDILEVSNPEALKKLCFELKNKLTDHLAVLCANIDGKAHVAISIADRVVVARNLDAGKIIKEHVAPLIKGGGGGQKSLAVAAGQEPAQLRSVIDKVRTLL